MNCPRLLAVTIIALSPLLADEYAVLKSGFRMSAQHIEKQESVYRLTTASGMIELAEAEVVAIEKDDYVPPPAPPVAVQTAVVASPAGPKPIPQMLDEAAERHGLPSEFVRSVAKAESGMRANA